jgi:hypothetical protein
MTGSSDTRPFGRWFQIRWAERLGDPDRPYLIRWTFIIFGFSIRIHHWLRSDDRRYFHDHSSDFISIVLRGWYCNVVPIDPDLPPEGNSRAVPAFGLFGPHKWFRWRDAVWFSKAEQRHYLDIPRSGAWTLLIEGKKYHKWGFYVPRSGEYKVRKMRPLRYFHNFGIAQADPNYQ